MTVQFKFVALSASMLILLAGAGAAHAGETLAWNYLLTGANPTSGTQRPTSGANKLELFQENGTYTFRIRGSTAPLCYSTEVPAAVEQDGKTLTITPTPRFGNCERIRLVINKDGSGGVQQSLQGKKGNQGWVTDEDRDYGLTPR